MTLLANERPTVLVVDDTPANLSLLSNLLKEHYRIKVANNGIKALELAAAAPPDLVLLDIMMPEMDGFEVCRRLKAAVATREVPVIFLTAKTEVEDEELGFSVGAVDFIHKPISPPIVLARVKTHLEIKTWHYFLKDQNAWLKEEVGRRLADVSRLQESSIMAMVSLAELRDESTSHTRNTQQYVRILAEQLARIPKYADHLTVQRIELIAKSAPLHDIGKIAISDHILLKPGKLTPEEFDVIKTHAQHGYEILHTAGAHMGEQGDFLAIAMEVARYHHEQWDGSGYPDGLAGEQIPLAARLMAVADVFDALTTSHPYRAAMTREQAVAIIVQGSGTHFDPHVVEAFIAIQNDSSVSQPCGLMVEITKIGKYELVRELGKGATSTVYLAHDPFADRQVAIKLLKLEGQDAEESKQFKKLFLIEASLAGKLEHPYIASIFDAVIADDASYLVMEYVGGGTLERYCQVDNLLPTDKVIEIVFKCCHALNYACANGIIHRDIKPENILIVDGTDIKISDFGAAIVNKGDANETHPIVGSLAYMSPQQAQGMELTLQADIYSLGVMFYKMLTGSLPFPSNDASLLFQILHVDPPLPSTYRMDIPTLIDNIVMKSLAKNLEDRYQSWEEFEQELTSASEKLPREVSSFPDTEKFNTLHKLDFFKDFGEKELWEVLRLSNWAYYPEDTTIIREGDETTSFFIIFSGEAEIRKNGRKISAVNAGECVGEMSGIRKGVRRRSASVIACSDIKLIEIYDQALGRSSEVCQRYFDKAFLELFANRLEEAMEQNKSNGKAAAKLSETSPTDKEEALLR